MHLWRLLRQGKLDLLKKQAKTGDRKPKSD
jgi:hypothetical protein